MHWRLKEWCRYVLYTVILLVLAKVASWDLPIVMGCVIVDAMDPNKPGRLTGVVISPLERLTEVVIVGLCVWGIVKLNKSYKQP